MRQIVFLLLLSLTACTKPSDAPASEPDLDTHLERLRQYHEATDGKALLVLQDGVVRHESYARGTTATDPEILASGTKSFNGIAAAAAVQDGLMRFDDRASDYVPEWKTDPRKSRITVRQLLNLTSGLLAGEDGSTTNMEAWDEILNKPMRSEPGERFAYGGYSHNAFAAVLQRQLMRTRNETYEGYLNRRILQPLGIRMGWNLRCADGNPQVAGGAAMTARSWATFGEFVRNRGRWKGQSLIRPELIDECVKPTVPQNPAYGLTWWLKEPVSESLAAQNPTVQQVQALGNATWAPEDLFFAAGAGKQRLYIFPTEKLVVVRFSDFGPGSQRVFTDEDFVSLLLRGKKVND